MWTMRVSLVTCLNESPSEKEGKLSGFLVGLASSAGLNESPSEKEGKLEARRRSASVVRAPQ